MAVRSATRLRELTEATDWLLAAPAREAAAGAVPVPDAVRHGDRRLADGACGAAGTMPAAGERHADADFMAAKRITAQHYALHVLPESGALRDEVMHGAVTTLGLNDAQF